MEQRCPSSLPWSLISPHMRGEAGLPWDVTRCWLFQTSLSFCGTGKTLLWSDYGVPSLVGQVVLVGKSHQQLPEMPVLSHSDGGVVKDVLKALFSAWCCGTVVCLSKQSLSPWHWHAASCCSKPATEQSSLLSSRANPGSSDISVN